MKEDTEQDVRGPRGERRYEHMPKKQLVHKSVTASSCLIYQKEQTSHSQVRYIFDLQSTYTIWSYKTSMVISVSAMFHVQGRVFQYAVNRGDCHSVSYLRDVLFVCVSRTDKFFWMNDLLAEWNNLTPL